MDETEDALVRRLVDRAEIHDLLYRYCRGVDRCDPDLVRSAYHQDSYDHRGYWRGNGHEFAAYITERLRAANSATTHSVTNALVEIDGDAATSESHVRATLLRRDSAVVDVVGARYLDRLSRRDGVWRIDQRTVVLDWRNTERWQPSEAPFATGGFRTGGRAPDDPVYAVLGPRLSP